MSHQIEKMDVADLKRAFQKYLDATGFPRDLRQRRNEWMLFWRRLRPRISVVERF